MILGGIVTTICLTASFLVINIQSVPLKNISKHPVLLVVSFDGFRYDYLEKFDLPTLHELQKQGVSVPYMEPVFPTKTFPNYQSIATGLYPEAHGVIGNSLFDPEHNRTLDGFTDDPGFWNYHPDVLPIWIRNEMAGEGRTSGCLMWPGCSSPYGSKNDFLPTHHCPYCNNSVPWENRVDMAISWITNDTKPANLVFLYFDEPDTRGHAFGPNHKESLNQILDTDNRTACLISKLKDADLYDKTNLIFLSDHGMEEVAQGRIINITALIDASHVKTKHVDSPVAHLIPNEGKGDELYDSLSNHGKTHGFTIWTKEEMRKRFHCGQSRRVLDYVLIANPGYAFDDLNLLIAKYNKKWNLTADFNLKYGVHGYSPEAPSMRPFFIALGPAFRKGFEFHQPIRSIDVFSLMIKILGLPSAPSNGSLERVVEMLEV